MKTVIGLFLLISCATALADEKPKVDAKTSQVLTTMLRHVLSGKENKSARDFYGTKGDKTVILINGSDKGEAAKWPPGFVPEIEGFTFVFKEQDNAWGNEKIDRRLEIRLDRFLIDAPIDPEAEKEGGYPYMEKSPIQISIQNGGGVRNGGVIGGQSTWYWLDRKKEEWAVKYAGALD